jgi:hypothetical protein
MAFCNRLGQTGIEERKNECWRSRSAFRAAIQDDCYYEDIGLISPGRAGNGYRDYGEDDIHRLAFCGARGASVSRSTTAGS